MTFDGEYFQQIFGLCTGTNVAPIYTNIYMAMLENELKSEVQNWPQTNLADSIQTVYWWWLGDRKEVFHWIQKFNELRKTVQMGKLLLITWTFSYTKATPFIWMANFQSLFIKKRLISVCTSLFVSFHQQHTIKNIVLRRALCALQFGGENFQKSQISIFAKLAQ